MEYLPLMIGGLAVTILVVALTLYLVVSYRKNKEDWTKGFLFFRRIGSAVVAILAFGYCAVRLFLMAFEVAGTNLILADFIVLVLVSLFAGLLCFVNERRKERQKKNYKKLLFWLGFILIQAAAAIVWYFEFTLPPISYMIMFFGLILVVGLYLFLDRDPDDY